MVKRTAKPRLANSLGRPDGANAVSAAEITDVDGIHPGYGFLAENAHFAEVCRDCKIEFIGPPAEAMRLLGNKKEARSLAQRIGVPVISSLRMSGAAIESFRPDEHCC